MPRSRISRAEASCEKACRRAETDFPLRTMRRQNPESAACVRVSEGVSRREIPFPWPGIDAIGEGGVSQVRETRTEIGLVRQVRDPQGQTPMFVPGQEGRGQIGRAHV